MSNKDDNNKKNNKNDKDEFDPYSFFKLSVDDDDKGGGNKGGKPPRKFPVWGLFAVVLGIVLIFNLLTPSKSEEQIDFSEFKKLIENGNIVRVEMEDSYFTGYGPGAVTAFSSNNSVDKYFRILSSGSKDTPRDIYHTIGKPDQTFISLMDAKGVEYKFIVRQNGYILNLLFSFIIPLLCIFAFSWLIFRKMGGGMSGSIFGAGGGKAKAVDEGKVKTRFSDVAGVDEAKEELVEVVDFLKSPKKYTDIGGKIPKGVLLVGPPGTGKTLLARAVAGEAGVPFFSISGSDFVEMFVGVGASRVRDLFKQAREKAPCIVFIDEIDALGKSRVNGFGGGNDEREQTLNQLLVEMDGFENEKGLIILAATNRADILDPALLRPGRFDRQVPVEKPDVKGREEILRIHAKNVKLDDDVNFESVAHGTVGFAGADLANVVNEAALLAVRNGRKKVTMEDFNEAIDKVSIGLKKKSRKDNKKEMRLCSVHETGHALVAAFTPDHEPVNKITVVPRSHGVGGFTQYREQEEKNFWTQKDMINEIDSSLGGRAAEEIILGDISTGASNDIARATDIVKQMITVYGMSDRFKNMTLGRGVLGNRGGEPTLVREFSEETQDYVDKEIARIMNERYEHVLKLLSDHKELLEYISNRLEEIETMDGKEFAEIVKAESHCAELAAASDKSKEEKPEENTVSETKAAAEDTEVKSEIKKRGRKPKAEKAEASAKSKSSEKEEKPKRKPRTPKESK